MDRDAPLGPLARIEAYFDACNCGTAAEIGAHFTDDAVVWDTNLAPCRGREAIGAMWVKIRQRWGGATWSVDSAIAGPDGTAAAIEWTMRGTDPRPGGTSFAFRGSEHCAFRDDRITEIRQYWTYDPERLDTGLVDRDYSPQADRARIRQSGASERAGAGSAGEAVRAHEQT